MFLLGIMVGRGNSPVTFDTRGFQERLASIARGYGKASEAGEKIELQFYEALDEPAKPEVLEGKIKPKRSLLAKSTDTGGLKDPEPVQVASKKTAEKDLTQETAEAKEVIEVKEDKVRSSGVQNAPVPESETLPVKTAMKSATLNKAALARFKPDQKESSGSAKETSAKKDGALEKKSGQTPEKTVRAEAGKKTSDREKDAAFTIQVASYKALEDALSQMAMLDKKGFSSIRTEKKIKETVWHRVRCGSFATYEDAVVFLEQLKKGGFNGLIMKKE